jgi:phenylacetate-coenzyme A ligase PaaK-like adenylate-forming protein
MVAYETLQTRHAQQAAALVPEHQQRIIWPADRLRAEREAQLRSLIGYAKEHSPWHRDRLGHIDAGALTADDLRSIPPMTKDDMMVNLDAILTDPRLSRDVVESHLDTLTDDTYLLDEFHAVASGGSSGTRGVFVYDWEGWLLCRLQLLRFAIRKQRAIFAPDFTPVAVHVAAGKATHMTFAMTRTFGAGSGVTPVPATLPLAEIVARLNDLQPEILGGYPTMLYALAGEARAGRLSIKPRMLRPGSEPLLPEMREAMLDVWGASIINILGTSEGATASSCGESEGMHLNEDLVIFELVDANGDPVPPGVRAAKMYITNLYNRAQPLIRYELTDEATLINEPCPCGSAMRRIADIEGRSDDLFTYDGGLVVHPLIFRSRIGHERNVIEYQVTQTPRGASIAVRTQGEVDTASIAADLESELRRLGLREPGVTVQTVDGFDRQATGKLKRFIPLR